MSQSIVRFGIVAMLITVSLWLHDVARAQIAPGVQQSAAQTGTVTGVVVRSDGTPIPGADVKLTGPAVLSTKSDAHGAFGFVSVPYGLYTLTSVAADLNAVSRAVTVRGDIAVTIQYAPSTNGLKTIAQVSTQSVGAQINVTAASVASVTPADYAFQGNTSWKELLDRIPGVAVNGQYNGSGIGTTIADGPLQPVVLSINGALPYETAVTLDGMPLVNTSSSIEPGAGFDLYAIPLAAFDAADVVRGPGANAPSIVDSIGGSFVLHAPGAVAKNAYEFSISNDPYGGVIANARAAVRLGRLSATFAYQTDTTPGPWGSQKLIPAYTFAPASVNGLTFFGCAPVPLSLVTPPNSPYQNDDYHIQTSFLACCTAFTTASAVHSGAAALSYAVSPSVTAQLFYAGSAFNVSEPGPLYPEEFLPGPGYTGPLAAGSYYFANVSTSSLAQASSLVEEKVTAYVKHGVFRFGALQNNSFSYQTIPNGGPGQQNTLYGTAYVGNTAPGTYTAFNGSSAYLANSYAFSYFDESWVNNRDLLASYATQLGSVSTLDVSYVSSYYNAPQEEVDVYSPPYNFLNCTTNIPSSISETTREFRVHAGTQLGSRLAVDASWYVADGSYHVLNPANPNVWADASYPYSGPRVGATWSVNRDMVIRASAGGGYALPPLNYLVGADTTPSCNSLTGCIETVTNLNLQPEKSFAFDVGADLRLHRDTVLSLDLYRTNLYGQFFQSTNLTGTLYSIGVLSNVPLYITQYNNLGQSRFEGLNLDMRHEVPHGFYWHVAVGLTRGYVVSLPNGFYNLGTSVCNRSTGANCQNTYIVPGINFDGQYQATVPYAGGSAEFGYRWAPEKYVDLAPIYYGNNNVYLEPAFMEFDAHAGYPLTRNISLLATFRNITGIHDQDVQVYLPSTGAPAIVGDSYALYGIPYGPRTAILSLEFKY